MRWKTWLVKSLVLVFWGAALCGYGALPASGEQTDIGQTYLPLIFAAPAPPAWIGPGGGHISAAAARAGIVYAGTWGAGIYKSADGGATWSWKSAGLGNRFIGAIAMDPHNPQIVYAGTRGNGIYKSVNGGETWFSANNGIAAHRQVYTIAIDPHDGENILIGTRSITPGETHPPWYGIVYRSTDQGNTWKAVLTDIGGEAQQDWVYSLAISYQNSRLVYAATHEHHVFRSNTFGKHWEPANNGITDFSTRGVVVNPLSTEPSVIVYVGTWIDGAVFRSSDGGNNWLLSANAPGASHIISMNIDPGGNFVYAATFGGRGVLRTKNGGNTWKISGLGGMDTTVIAVDAQNSSTIYGGTDGQGLYKSTDYGTSWSRQEHLYATDVSDLAVAFDDAQSLFASVDTLGVQSSRDGGASWSALGRGLEDTDVLGLAASPDAPRTLYALTSDQGLYRCNRDDIENDCWTNIPINFSQMRHRQPELALWYPFTTVPFIDDELSDLSPAPTAPTGKPVLREMRFAHSHPQTAYLATYGAGVYKSLDGGANWIAAGLDSQAIVALAVSPVDERDLFAASYTAIWHSADGGASWADTGFSGADVYALALDDSGTLYAGTSNGIYRYQNEGWTHLALGGLSVPALVLRPDKPGWIYAGTINGLQFSRNGGATWNAGPEELENVTINALSLDPDNPCRIYVSTKGQGVLRMQLQDH
ncbi:MAG TPA: hypothetical protein EYP88_01605 [Anaerolineales bacterium]|nr:hypothetical protein [Anaerolineales bacterium]